MSTQEEHGKKVLELFKSFEQFSRCLLDGYVICDSKGKILKANPLMSVMSGMSSKQLIKAASISEVFKFEVASKDLSFDEIMANKVPTRVDEVTAVRIDDQKLNCIMGVFPFVEGDETLGVFLLIRDVTAESALQGKYSDKAKQSITDKMTGLFNRAYFEDFMATQERVLPQYSADSDHRKMSVLMLDIDFFKKINDTYGHKCGDMVIKETSQLMFQTFRKTDICCRYGGEEFLVFLPSSDIAGACTAAEKFRQSIETNGFEFEGKNLKVTISGGVAQINVGFEKISDTIARADEALYHSKKSGRNLISISTGSNGPIVTYPNLNVDKKAS